MQFKPSATSKQRSASTQITRHNLDSAGPKPQLSNFYLPSGGQKDCKIAFVNAGMVATGLQTCQVILTAPLYMVGLEAAEADVITGMASGVI